MSDESNRAWLRHTLATLAYRGGKAVRDVPEDVANRRLAPTSRTPLEIFAHVNDLLDWSLELCEGRHVFHESTPAPWSAERERFFAGLEALDRRLAAAAPLGFAPEQIFQGPIADALTHIGQIALVRRVAGAPVRGENYFRAHIAAGRVGPDQAAPVREFE